MKTEMDLGRVCLIFTLCCVIASSPIASAQTTQGAGSKDQDVVRVFTELVQTDVMVFDKDGHFANNLRREDFELRIDGKPRPIEFFERVNAGSANEEIQLAAARGSTNSTENKPVVPLDRGRTVFFYVDDLHMDLSGANQSQKLISRFIENEMKQNDEAAVVSASGQIGFLQQLTDNRTVLRKAIERLKPKPYVVTDMERPAMSEFQALQINQYDQDTTDVFVEALLRDTPLLPRDTAVNMVRTRAQNILLQAANITRSTLSGLESLVRSSSALPGRKIVFFISNGFFLDRKNSDSAERVQHLTSAAARNGVVIYTLDARGLVASLVDASTDAPFDPSGRLDRSSRSELTSSQDAMNAIARDTGGRPVFNTNALETGLKNALTETSTYYLLAWKPDSETPTGGKFRKLEVKLVNKPDLAVRVRRGFFDIEPQAGVAAKKKTPKPDEKTPETKLREAITAAFPQHTLPVSLALSYVDTQNKGEVLSASLAIPSEFLTFTAEADKSKAVVDIAGFVYDDQGRVGAKFNDHVTVTSNDAKRGAEANDPPKSKPDLVYNFPIFLGPGLYQVRVGARDAVTGKAGSAHSWIEIPNLASGQLAMSSLLIGEHDPVKNPNGIASTGRAIPDTVSMSIDRRFHRDSYLRFLVFIYNAAHNAPDAKPDAAVQVQLIRDDQPVVTTALRKIDLDGVADLTRLPYAADVPLSSLTAGHYLLHVTVVDRVAKRSASQQTRFEIY